MENPNNVFYIKQAQERSQKVRDLEVDPHLMLMPKPQPLKKDGTATSLFLAALTGSVLCLAFVLALAWI